MGIIFLSLMVLAQLVPFLKNCLSGSFAYRASSKMEKLSAYSVCFLVFVAICAGDVKETTQFKLQDSNKETVSITVRHTEVERGKDGKFKDEKSLKVIYTSIIYELQFPGFANLMCFFIEYFELKNFVIMLSHIVQSFF